LRSAADPLPPDTAAWVERQAGRGWRIVRARRLTGGIATATHELTLAARGRSLRLVLRRPKDDWGPIDPHQMATQAATLDHVRTHTGGSLPCPEVVAVAGVDDTADRRTAILMRKLPGRIDLDPADRASWLQQQADTLAAIHALPLPSSNGRHPQDRRDEVARFRAHLRTLSPPTWSAHPRLWATALELVAGTAPPTRTRTFGHGDFQHFNLLWSRGRLTGVVDWGSRRPYPPSRDAGHNRLNLVILYGSAVADDFRRRYEAASGRSVDPWWDLAETLVFLPSWGDTIRMQVRRRIPFDVDSMHRRVDAHLPVLLDRLRREHAS
jgi:aminoglycoside phosphotransferase (APT) family kinase protein